jgi:hypothetical protein
MTYWADTPTRCSTSWRSASARLRTDHTCRFPGRWRIPASIAAAIRQ